MLQSAGRKCCLHVLPCPCLANDQLEVLSYAWRVLGGFNHMVWLFGKRSDLEPDLPHKEIGDKEPYYSTKSSIFSFIWAGLAALHKASTI